MLETTYKGKYRYKYLDPKGKDRMLGVKYRVEKKILWFWITVGYVKEID